MSVQQELLRNNRKPVVAPRKAWGWWDEMLALRGRRGQGDPEDKGSQLGSAMKKIPFTIKRCGWDAILESTKDVVQ